MKPLKVTIGVKLRFVGFSIKCLQNITIAIYERLKWREFENTFSPLKNAVLRYEVAEQKDLQGKE